EEKPRSPSDITVFGANCTLHGLSHIFLPGGVTLRRLLWAAAFSASLSIFLYQVADRVIEYYRYPHVTILDEMDSPVMYFPAVTLCNYNSFRKSQIRRNDIFWMAGLLGVEQGDFDDFMAAVGQPTDNSKFFPSKTFNMLEFVQRTSHSIEDMLLDCKYRGKDCGPENFTTIYTRYGKCYTFNSGLDGNPLLTTLKGGTGNGLEIMLDIQQDEYLPVWGETGVILKIRTLYLSAIVANILLKKVKGTQQGTYDAQVVQFLQDSTACGRYSAACNSPCWCSGAASLSGGFLYRCLACIDETSYEAGIKVQIHSQDEPPFIDQLGFGVAPGFQTFVSCQQQLLQYLPPPWGDCKSTPIDSEYFSTYSISACRIDCETRYLLENCNCRMVHMPGMSTVCTPEQYKDCADPALDFLVEKDNDYCVCQTPCNMTRYGKELSMVKIPSKASAKYLAKKFNKTEQYIGENILVLDIFFEALNYEKIEQKKAYEIAGLLGDIGGQMGLFIGASVLTILEIFDYLYESTCDTLRSHSDSLGFTPNVLPRHPTLGNFEEFAC
ncbi:unnamed protein product, partial [Tetraodon nigroviridis]